ncbi:unnamed protein product [Prorocentrum cordatum]|uniref:Uncharacterized protein n=1 Tax=Prorocentrum cordatum TaxID=2364126 RepID=A0ABN9UJU6_9DINO|nr:unnamed protein product [Polarella glacialis]
MRERRRHRRDAGRGKGGAACGAVGRTRMSDNFIPVLTCAAVDVTRSARSPRLRRALVVGTPRATAQPAAAIEPWGGPTPAGDAALLRPVLERASAAAAGTLRALCAELGAPRGGRSGPSGGDQARLAKEVKELKQQLAVEEAKVQELESKPPSALAARHRVENASRKVEKLEEQLLHFEAQKQDILKGIAETSEPLAEARNDLEHRAKMLHKVNFKDVDDPVTVGMAGLDPTAVDNEEGEQALETLKRLQPEAKEAAERKAAEGGRAPGGGAPAGAAGAGAGGADGGGQAWAPQPPSAADFEGSDFHAGLGRAMEGENPEAAVAEFLAGSPCGGSGRGRHMFFDWGGSLFLRIGRRELGRRAGQVGQPEGDAAVQESPKQGGNCLVFFGLNANARSSFEGIHDWYVDHGHGMAKQLVGVDFPSPQAPEVGRASSAADRGSTSSFLRVAGWGVSAYDYSGRGPPSPSQPEPPVDAAPWRVGGHVLWEFPVVVDSLSNLLLLNFLRPARHNLQWSSVPEVGLQRLELFSLPQLAAAGEAPLGLRAAGPLRRGELLCFYPGRIFHASEERLPRSDMLFGNGYEGVSIDPDGEARPAPAAAPEDPLLKSWPCECSLRGLRRRPQARELGAPEGARPVRVAEGGQRRSHRRGRPASAGQQGACA